MKKRKFILIAVSALILGACSSLKLLQVDFSWPIESVVKVDANGFAADSKFSYSVNVKPLFFEETKDSLNCMNKEVRMIRDVKGYYYVLSPKFKNIYVFESKGGVFQMYDKFLLNKDGLNAPFMNQRAPYIEVVDGNNKFLLNNEGLKK